MVRAGKSVAIAQVDVRDDEGALVAMGTATFRLAEPGTRRSRNED
jgi:acyl-coenzyme A thioesterase PaaI-like protein